MSNSFLNVIGDPAQDDGSLSAQLAKKRISWLPTPRRRLLRFDKRLSTSQPAIRRNWIGTSGTYLDATVHEVEDRERGTILGLEDYIDLRRGSNGAYIP